MVVLGKVSVNGEFISTNANAFRAAFDNYGFFIRNDGSHVYFMLTNKGDPFGDWNNLRPMYINCENGQVYIDKLSTGILQGNASTSTVPLGFTYRRDSWGWGSLTAANGYAQITNWAFNSGEIAFAEKGNQVSCQLDGFFYQREGNSRCLDVVDGESYMLKSGGTFTGGVTLSGRVYGTGDDEGLIITKASNGYAGLCLGSSNGVRSVFYLDNSNRAFWRYNNGSASLDIYHPSKSGTIALTSDLSDKASLSETNIYNGEQIFQNDTYCPTALDNAFGVGTAYKASRGAVTQEIVGQIIMPYTTVSDEYGCDNVANTIKFQRITDAIGGIPTYTTVASMSTSSFTYNGNEVITAGNINGYTVLASKRLNTIGSVGNSSMNHATAFENVFMNYSSSLPKSTGLFSYIDNSYSNQSAGIGFFLSGYDSSPYGGAFVMHYNQPFYVGVTNGTYIEQRIITGPKDFYGSSLPSSGYSGAVYFKLV